MEPALPCARLARHARGRSASSTAGASRIGGNHRAFERKARLVDKRNVTDFALRERGV
jgi:hypothetical protein